MLENTSYEKKKESKMCGLSSEEAKKRLEIFGYNLIVSKKQKTFFTI